MTYPYEKQIIRALHDVDEGLAAPPPDNSFQRYARHADDYRVTINRFRRIPYVACTAIVQATDESLAQLFATYSNVAHQPLSPAFINYFVRHEAQHASCAQKLGATAVWYALSFCRAEADIFGQVYDIDGA
ncbi:MAG TPA: hypothetical protein VFT53_01700, partial [Candidatus Saccharimonadales bacterium]|nr:hypothetical protein [Candidatus Saccharimonadales bacterium]